ncbi:MAG TPA: LamG domain-containing protein [Anaerohalosphaeraceae bacterium]|nr:LamG domain-containing protein [Anaerohalosphaeraceae bacterium]HOL89716.1 LamG domain-containing protein [Anaerohalosphaeraceae bacterium]HPP56746.1 LamG domain-containing protein [Anaerohalosphaeraceae bacterium]
MMMKKSLRMQWIVSVCLAILFCGASMGAQKVIEWKFDGDLADSSGSGLDGIAFGTPAYTAGVSGQAFVSDGTNCVYRTGISTALLPVLAADTWSVNVWVYPTENPRDWRVLWCLGEKPDASKNSRAVYASGYADYGGLITFVGRTTTATTYISSMIPWDINKWQMITTTYDGRIVRIYKNGVLIAMRNTTFMDAPGEVRIPSNPWNSYDFFIGRFDEFTVWRGVLTADEIRNLIVPGVLAEVPTTRQVAYYKMENPSGFVMPDYSGLDNDGQLWGYTDPISDWLAEGYRGDALRFDGGQRVNLPVSVTQPVNYTVSFWFKSGEQPYYSAFYCEKQTTPVPGNLGLGTQFLIRANNSEIQVISKERDYNALFLIGADARAYLDGQTWHHLAVVADGEAARARLYIDGQELASADYPRSSHKTTTLTTSIGYSWSDGGYLGEWGDTYIDEVTIWNGALTPAQIQALAARSNLNSDQAVDLLDAAAVSEDWMEDTVEVPGDLLVADDMEGPLNRWSVYASSRYSGTGTISQTSNAYTGSYALQWDYELPATAPTDPNNYASILFDFGETKNLFDFDAVSLWLYRHSGNSEEDILFLKFIDENMQVKAEQWIVGSGATVQPVNQWAEWVIDPNSLRGPGGVGTADEGDLTDIRYIMIGTGSGDRSDARSGRIDIDEFRFIRYPVCAGFPRADMNKDCKVDLDDLFVLVEEWLLGIE